MFEQEMDVGAYYKIKFKGYSHQLGMMEIVREKKHKFTLMLDMEEIRVFRAHLKWLEGQILKKEKLHYDNPPEADFKDSHGDDEC